jgi:hypothetical protein
MQMHGEEMNIESMFLGSLLCIAITVSIFCGYLIIDSWMRGIACEVAEEKIEWELKKYHLRNNPPKNAPWYCSESKV